MPVMHGYEFITRVRKDPRFNDIPIVVLTSRGTKRHEQKAIAAGADGYIIKPFDEVTISEILSKFEIVKEQI
jgi:FOG: CheY-like receiver